MKWTLEVTREEVKDLIRNKGRQEIHNALARAVPDVPFHHGRYGWYGDALPTWEKVCPGIQETIAQISFELEQEKVCTFTKDCEGFKASFQGQHYTFANEAVLVQFAKQNKAALRAMW